MFDKTKKALYFTKLNLLYEDGIKNGKIVPFDDELYEKLSKTYISGIPVSIHIKHLRPTMPPGKCYDRSVLKMLYWLEVALKI